MKTFILFLLLSFPALAQESATPAPAPQVVFVQAPAPAPTAVQGINDRITNWTTIGMAILSAIGLLGGALVGQYFAIKAKVQAEVQSLKDRQDRQASKTGQLQSDLTSVAIAAGVPPPSQAPPPPAALILLLCGALAFTGCSSIGSTTTSIFAKDGKDMVGISQTFTFRDPHKTGLAK